jgi:serine/threonine protein kinase
MTQEDIDSCKRVAEPEMTNGSRLFGFYIMPRYTVSLDSLITEQGDNAFSHCLVLEIWTQLLESLKNLHKVGYTHNDIKPANIMFDISSETQVKATLIDFGFSQSFQSKSG